MAPGARPVPPEAEMIRLVMLIRSHEAPIELLLERLDRMYDERALAIARLYDGGLRYIDLQRLLDMNGGKIAAALNRAARARTEQATDRAADLVNERTIDHGA